MATKNGKGKTSGAARSRKGSTTIEEMEGAQEEIGLIELAEAKWNEWVKDYPFSDCRDAHLPKITRELYAGYQWSDPDRLVIKTRTCRRKNTTGCTYARVTLVRGENEALEHLLLTVQPDGYSPPSAARHFHSGRIPKSVFIMEDSFAAPPINAKARVRLDAAIERWEDAYA